MISYTLIRLSNYTHSHVSEARAVRCKPRHMRTVMPSSGSNPIIRATSNQPSTVCRGMVCYDQKLSTEPSPHNTACSTEMPG